jgi:uncharacterized membrane protein YedE/YeeE
VSAANPLPALVVGLAAGVVMARGGLCFNRALRRAVFERRPALLRAFAIAVAVQLVLLPALVALDVEPLARNAEAGGLPLLPVAQVVGGVTFGVGMALAGGCVTGMLWKAGSGSAALALAIAGFAAGEMLVRGAGHGLIETLDDAYRPTERSLAGALGVGYEPLALALGVLTLALALARSRRGAWRGAALGTVAAAAWLAADWAGYGYGLGFVGAAEGTRAAISAGGALPFQLFLALGVFTGAALAGPRRLRLPNPARAARGLAGGMLMGVGGSVAHGCNIGHGLTGVPLLSLGSLLATAAMAAGALLTWRLVLAPSPRLRGAESVRSR